MFGGFQVVRTGLGFSLPFPHQKAQVAPPSPEWCSATRADLQLHPCQKCMIYVTSFNQQSCYFTANSMLHELGHLQHMFLNLKMDSKIPRPLEHISELNDPSRLPINKANCMVRQMWGKCMRINEVMTWSNRDQSARSSAPARDVNQEASNKRLWVFSVLDVELRNVVGWR